MIYTDKDGCQHELPPGRVLEIRELGKGVIEVDYVPDAAPLMWGLPPAPSPTATFHHHFCVRCDNRYLCMEPIGACASKEDEYSGACGTCRWVDEARKNRPKKWPRNCWGDREVDIWQE